jgi:hypothetical protein
VILTQKTQCRGVNHANIGYRHHFGREQDDDRGQNSRLQSRVPAMIPEYDIEYSLVREAEERLASKNAADETARMVHTELADRYADRAWSAREARCEANLKC